MKKILLIFLVLFTANKSVLGECQDGIALKKDNRDWVKTYNNLVVKYKAKTEKVSSLKPFFYNGNKPKECISLKDLQSLNSKVQKVFKATKSDQTVTDFKGAISFIAKTNPPGAKSGVTDKSKAEAPKVVTNPAPQKDLANEKLDKQKDAKVSSLSAELKKLENERATLTDDKNFYKTSCLFLLGLLMGLIAIWILMVRNLKKESKKEIESLKTTFEEQREHYAKTIKDLEARNRENKNTVREAVPTVEPKAEVISIVKEPKKEAVPEPPKESAPKQFYLSTPAVSADGKGVFDGSEVYSATSISSLYHFVLINDKSADFTFLNTPNTVKDALTLPERYLQPACEYTGLNSKATKINTWKAGRAVREGNNWKVTHKAEIRFE